MEGTILGNSIEHATELLKGEFGELPEFEIKEVEEASNVLELYSEYNDTIN